MTTKVEHPENVGIWATFRESPIAVKAILAGVLLSRLGGFLNIFIVLYLTAKGYSAEQAAFALGVYGIGAVVGVLLGGSLADWLGARNSTVLSMTSTAVLTASLLYLPSYALLLAAIALISLAAQIYRPASAALLSELTPENRQVMIFGMYRFGLNVGAMAAPLVGFGLYHLNGESYTLLFWGEGIIAIVYAMIAAATIPARAGQRADAGADKGADAEEHAERGGYLAMLRDRRYVLYLFATMCNAIIYVQYLSTLPLDVKASGVDIFWYTFAVSLNGLIVIAFELPLTKISQHWSARVSIAVAFVLVGVGVAMYGLPLGAAVIIAATLVWTLGEIIGGPVAFAYPAMAGPAHLRSRYISSFQFTYALGAAIGPVVGGMLFVRLGHGFWPVIAIVGLLAAVSAVIAVRTPTKSAEAEPASASAVEATAG